MSSAFVGALAGPMLAVLFSFARIGPPGFIWWEDKGGGTIQTPLGRVILSIIFVSGGYAGAFGGWAIDTWYRRRPTTEKRKSDAGQGHLWDREMDG